MSLPPAQPLYILRGHAVPVHAVLFARSNSRLLTADADGWIVIWNVPTRRPVAVWKAHDAAILGLGTWGDHRIITHGRDNKLFVWEITPTDESTMDTILPLNEVKIHRRQPWLLHMLAVNTLNFCPFALCDDMTSSRALYSTGGGMPSPVLVAVPGSLNSDGIDVFHLPSELRVHSIPAETSVKTGMVMALGTSNQAAGLTVAAGYESGHTIVHRIVADNVSASTTYQRLYICQPHSQPVLSLDLAPSREFYCTSSADAIVAKHPLAFVSAHENSSKPNKVVNTGHSGQQGLRLRSDGTIFATAGWDCRIRVYSARSMKELAVLKWHREGCYALAFAQLDQPDARRLQPDDSEVTLTADNNQLTERQIDSPVVRAVEQRRIERAKSTHWLAAGSKDGKVSLWDIY